MNRTVVGIAASLLVAGNVLSAHASPTAPPDGMGDIKGLAWDAGQERLWIAGTDADDGTIVGASENAEPVNITFYADIVDVQGLAMANGALYVGDIGDEQGTREFITIYHFADAEPSEDKTYYAYDLAYPDGEQLHATALTVADDGTFYVVTDGDEAGVYVAPNPSRTEVNIMERVGDAPESVSDAVMLSDDLNAVLRSPDGLTIVDTLNGDTLAAESLPEDAKGEAMTLLDDETVLLADDSAIAEASVPVIEEPKETSGAEETAKASAEATPTEEAVEEAAEKATTPSNTGTIVALIMAGVVALGAATATYLARP